MSFTVRADRRFIRPGHRSKRHVLARVTAPEQRREHPRPPVNVAFVLDRSGSMSGQKIALARQAVNRAVQGLDPRDRFAVVVYDDQIDVLVESTAASGEAKRMVLGRLATTDARGSTNLADGWLRGCAQVGIHLDGETVGRCLLLTDGLANVGITDPVELEHHAQELRSRGVTTTTFGVGADFDEALLRQMSTAGGGNFYFLEHAAQIPDLLASELGEALDIVVRDAVLEIETDPRVRVEPLTWKHAESHEGLSRVMLGDLVSAQMLDIVLRFGFPYGTLGGTVRAALRLRDRDDLLPPMPEELLFEYASDEVNDHQPRDREIDRLVASLEAAKVREEAIRYNRLGEYDQAERRLEGAARKILAYAGNDPEVLAIAGELQREAGQFSREVREMDRKKLYFSASNVASMRGPQGQAIRNRPPQDTR
jgi:Ca-activated chloride channel family protein